MLVQLLLLGCSGVTWRDVEPLPATAAGAGQALRSVVLVRQQSTVGADNLRDVFHLADDRDATKQATDRFSHFEDLADQELKAALVARGFDVRAVNDGTVDYLLQYRITDFGRSPHKWIGWYVGWEVASTLAIGALAYARPSTRPIAGAYLVEETIEELVEGFAGFWEVNRLWSPVRIEGSLTDLHNGQGVWADANTGMADLHGSRLFKRARGAEQDRQLLSALHRSCEGLAESLIQAIH